MRTIAAAVALTLAIMSPVARASDPPPAESKPPSRHRLKWRDEWPRFRVIEYGVTALTFEELAFIQYRLEIADKPRWNSEILFDDAIRHGMRLTDAKARKTADDLSGVLALIPAIEPIASAAAVPLFFDRGNFDVFWQMTLINAESTALAGFVQRVGTYSIARARPAYNECLKDRSYGGCGGGTASFPSGHTSTAFVGAGLSCVNHLNVPLFGGGAPDVITCATNIVIATTTGVLRIMGDDHYATDVIAGGVIGFVLGYTLPSLLHYTSVSPSISTANLHAMLLPRATATDMGLQAIGWF